MGADYVVRFFETLPDLLWVALAIIIFYLIWPTIKEVMPHIKDRLKSKDLTIRIGSLEISNQKFAENLENSVTDIQGKIIELEGLIRGESTQNSDEDIHRKIIKDILWIDDCPENNAIIIAGLKSDGKRDVETVLSTAEAIRKLEESDYDIVISDMHRLESNIENNTAGLDILRWLMENNSSAKRVIFRGAASARRYGDDARALGANLVTASQLELIRYITLSA